MLRFAAGGVGIGGVPEVPGAIEYVRCCGEPGKGICCALIVPLMGFNWLKLAARCSDGDLGVKTRLAGRSAGPPNAAGGAAADRSGAAEAGCALMASGGKDGAGPRGDSSSEAFLLLFNP